MSQPANTGRLDDMARAIDDAFEERDADAMDRIDVLAKHAAFALAWGHPNDREAAIAEFNRMVRAYLERFDLAMRKPAGAA